jgi:hypothetical protein
MTTQQLDGFPTPTQTDARSCPRVLKAAPQAVPE